MCNTTIRGRHTPTYRKVKHMYVNFVNDLGTRSCWHVNITLKDEKSATYKIHICTVVRSCSFVLLRVLDTFLVLRIINVFFNTFVILTVLNMLST